MGLKRKRPPRKGHEAEREERGLSAAQQAYEQHRTALDGNIPVAPPRKHRFSQHDKSIALPIIMAWLAKGYTKSRALEEADVSPATLERWRAASPEIDAQIREAMEAGTDLIEDEARRRAVDGVDEPVFQQGECVGFKRVYSDGLMQMILGGRRPSRYGKSRVEHSGPDGAPIQHSVEVMFVDGDGQ
jgi:hypothetical protein